MEDVLHPTPRKEWKGGMDGTWLDQGCGKQSGQGMDEKQVSGTNIKGE